MVLFYSGWIVSTSLAGATVGSFTGGALADKFGRTRTFIMDSIPLAIGAFLRLIIINKNQYLGYLQSLQIFLILNITNLCAVLLLGMCVP